MLEKFLKACADADTAELDVLLRSNPTLLGEKIQGKKNALEYLASQENFSVLDYILTHSSYTSKPINEKSEFLRDIGDALDNCANDLKAPSDDSSDDSSDVKAPNKVLDAETVIRLKNIYKKCIFYTEKILANNDDDFNLLGDQYYQLSLLYNEKTFDQEITRQEYLSTALFNYSKVKVKEVAHCYNMAITYHARASSLLALTPSKADCRQAFKDLHSAKSFLKSLPEDYEESAQVRDSVDTKAAVCNKLILEQEAKEWGRKCPAQTSTQQFTLFSALQAQLQEAIQANPSCLTKAFSEEEFNKLNEEKRIAEIRQSVPEDLNAYVDKRIQEGIWSEAEAIHILQISRHLKMNLIFVRGDGEPEIIIRQPGYAATLMMGITHNHQYFSLSPDPEHLTPTKSISERLHCTPRDGSPKRTARTDLQTIEQTTQGQARSNKPAPKNPKNLSEFFLKFSSNSKSSAPTMPIVRPTPVNPQFFQQFISNNPSNFLTVPVSNHANHIHRKDNRSSPELRHKKAHKPPESQSQLPSRPTTPKIPAY